VMHYSTLPCRHTLVYSTSWDSPVRMPAPSISGSFFDTRGYYPRLLYRLIHWGAPKCGRHFCPPASSPSTSWKTCHRLAHCSRADRPAQGFSLNNLATTMTSTVVDYNLNFKLHARPPELKFKLRPLVTAGYCWLHRQHGAVSVVQNNGC
jgi:hypothetical protein